MECLFFCYPDRPWGPPSLLYNGYRVFPGGKERPGRDTAPSPLLVPWSWKSRAISLLPLWAVRPVQSLSACTRVHFTLSQCLYKSDLYLPSVPVQGRPLPYLSACTRVTFTFYLFKDIFEWMLKKTAVLFCLRESIIRSEVVYYTGCSWKRPYFNTTWNKKFQSSLVQSPKLHLDLPSGYIKTYEQ